MERKNGNLFDVTTARSYLDKFEGTEDEAIDEQHADARAVEWMIQEADQLYSDDHYAESERVARHALEAAASLGTHGLGLWIRALFAQADALRMQGRFVDARLRYEQVLAIAQDQARDPGEDPVERARALEPELVLAAVAQTYMSSIECAGFIPGMELAGLLHVVEDGLAWLRSVDRWHWRAGLLHSRAVVFRGLGRVEDAITAAEDALAIREEYADAPGPTLSSHRCCLGDLLRDADRAEEATPLYQRVLDDPASPAYDRYAAYEGLAWCALAADQSDPAREHAERSVREAELLGDDALATALEALVAACRRQGDRFCARRAAQRQVEAARRTRSQYRLYHALRSSLDVDLDTEDPASLPEIREILQEIAPIARAMDRSRGDTAYTDEVAWRERRLAAFVPLGAVHEQRMAALE